MTASTHFLLSVHRSPRLLATLLLGFSSGLPFLLVFSTLSRWLREEGVSRAAIGFFVWAGLFYSFKFIWAPLLDRHGFPGFSALLGLRRGWILAAKTGLILALAWVAFTSPGEAAHFTAIGAMMVAFSSATQDSAIDAWRIEMAKENEQAAFAAATQLGYRFGLMAAGAGALLLAEQFDWRIAYLVMAALIALGATTLLWCGEPNAPDGRAPRANPATTLLQVGIGLGAVILVLAAVLAIALSAHAAFGALSAHLLQPGQILRPLSVFWAWFGPYFGPSLFGAFFISLFLMVRPLRAMRPDAPSLRHPFIGPFADFIRRHAYWAIVILGFIATCRLSDFVMGVMAQPLYADLGYSKSAVALYSGAIGIWVTIAGVMIGAAFALRFGLRPLLAPAVLLAAIPNLAFAWLALAGGPQSTPGAENLLLDNWPLGVAIFADNIANGFAQSIFIGYMSSLTNKQFTATQYALFASLFALFAKIMAGFAGLMADALGYVLFFVLTTSFALPALVFAIALTRAKLVDHSAAANGEGAAIATAAPIT